jgi:metal-responsive CopG/Arc/MetJ family transcriptional regulator
MSITEQLVKILNEKTKKSKVVVVSPRTILNWEKGKSSPKLSNVDQYLEENKIDVLLYDGDQDKLIEFAHEIGKKTGKKVTISFEK